MDVGGSGVTNIFSVPHEMLVNILLYFNARERLAFAKTCIKFKNLVLDDPELLRNLDFSRNGWLTTMEDVQVYFTNETRNKFIRKVNISGIFWMRPGEMLRNTIGKAVNLVDVNVMGIRFEDVRQLGSFLALLIHVKKLILDWPEPDEDVDFSIRVMKTPFGKLNYLIARVRVYSINFFPTVQFCCNELVDLRVIALPSQDHELKQNSWRLYGHNKLKKLKIVQAHGWDVHRTIYRHIINMLPDLTQWTDFQMIGTDFANRGFYLEKNLDISDQLLSTRVANNIENFPVLWSVLSESLVQETVKLNYEKVPKDFCCFRRTGADAASIANSLPLALRVEEAKRLLKDPGYQITFLNLEHDIEAYCDVHLVGFAFPNLRDLILYRILKAPERVRGKELLPRRLASRDSGAASTSRDELAGSREHSFRILIDNTPQLRDLTICFTENEEPQPETWDLDSLLHIARWRHLTALRLAYVPILDGRFLVEIGKNCENLQILVLIDLAKTGQSISYMNDVSDMLTRCRNIREFSFSEEDIFGVFNLLTSLSCNPKLESVDILFCEERENLPRLVASMEHLLYNCKMLNKFKYTNVWTMDRVLYRNYLVGELRRIKGELNRPEFQFEVVNPFCKDIVIFGPDGEFLENIDIIHEACPPWYFNCRKLNELTCRIIFPLLIYKNNVFGGTLQ
ncbi:uncharacterized protein LOC124187215 isoform X1 [Neodiprion fabricii]|uniref:uncharacterized protein LOC124187215 isoform X1 n=1 Tax=Neodiprion fabricii TaxID=2872261 RepID=UPI001ED8F78F|nr:uncharacterized protein LOC124187215 isoform X1 [Neodiprion fabricii]